MVHQPSLWHEIERVVAMVDAEVCKTKVSQERRSFERLLFSPKDLNRAFTDHFINLGWRGGRVDYWVTRDHRLIRKTLGLPREEQRRAILDAGEVPIASYNQTDFVKERIAVEVQFGKYAFVAYDLFVKHLAFYVGDQIDVGVEILPMKSLQSHMSSGPAYYEGELYNALRQGRGVPAVPLVLLGVEP
jgi:hypothetical protein